VCVGFILRLISLPVPLGLKVSCHLQWQKALPIRSCCFCGQTVLTLALSIGSGSFRFFAV